MRGFKWKHVTVDSGFTIKIKLLKLKKHNQCWQKDFLLGDSESPIHLAISPLNVQNLNNVILKTYWVSVARNK